MESPVRDADAAGVKVIEVLRYQPGGRLPRAALHLARMDAACRQLGFAFRPADAAARLTQLDFDRQMRLRLTVDAAGRLELTWQDLAANPDHWRLAIAPRRVASDDPWLRIKTTRRQIYDDARRTLPENLDEMVFVNERGEITEGTITNLFVQTAHGLATPPLDSGLLPGVLRAWLLQRGRAYEAVLRPDDLRAARGLWVGNSLRGLIPARLAG